MPSNLAGSRVKLSSENRTPNSGPYVLVRCQRTDLFFPPNAKTNQQLGKHPLCVCATPYNNNHSRPTQPNAQKTRTLCAYAACQDIDNVYAVWYEWVSLGTTGMSINNCATCSVCCSCTAWTVRWASRAMGNWVCSPSQKKGEKYKRQERYVLKVVSPGRALFIHFSLPELFCCFISPLRHASLAIGRHTKINW